MKHAINCLTGLALFAATALSAQSVLAADLLSYRAGYKVSTGRNQQGSGIENVTGQIAFGSEKVCGGWLQQQSVTMHVNVVTGEVVSQSLHYSAWENDEGTQMRYNTTNDDGKEAAVRGQATFTPDQGGIANFTNPESESFTLPKDTMFPVAHTRFMVERASAGEDYMQSHLFEGVDVEGAKLVVIFVSPLSDEGRAAADQAHDALKGVKGWTFRLAYFDPNDRTGEPVYEIEADLLENGVASRWVLDYGEFDVVMSLAKLEVLQQPDC